jgi:hypothetical protein
MVRYIKATDLTAEQRQCLEEAIRNDAHAERRWSAEALSPHHARALPEGWEEAVDQLSVSLVGEPLGAPSLVFREELPSP